MLTNVPFDDDEDEMSGDVTVHGESTAHTSDDKSDIATGVPRLFRRWETRVPPPSRSCSVHHARGSEVNHDASRSCAAGDSCATVRHASNARAGCLGNGELLRAAIGIVLLVRIRRCNTADRGRTAYRCRRRRGKQRTENDGWTLASSVNQQPTSHRQTNEVRANL